MHPYCSAFPFSWLTPLPSSFSSGNNSSPVHGWVSPLKQRALMDGWHLKGQQEQQRSFIFFITTALSGFYTRSCVPALYSLHLPICAAAVMAAKCHQRRKWLMRLALPQISDSSHALRNQTTFGGEKGGTDFSRFIGLRVDRRPLLQACGMQRQLCQPAASMHFNSGGAFWGHLNVWAPFFLHYAICKCLSN